MGNTDLCSKEGELYALIRTNNITLLVDTVNKLLTDNWLLLGNILSNEQNNDIIYTQALVKDKKYVV